MTKVYNPPHPDEEKLVEAFNYMAEKAKVDFCYALNGLYNGIRDIQFELQAKRKEALNKNKNVVFHSVDDIEDIEALCGEHLETCARLRTSYDKIDGTNRETYRVNQKLNRRYRVEQKERNHREKYPRNDLRL